MNKHKLEPQTKLERHVARWANDIARDYDSGLTGVFQDLFYGGCQSGMVSHLIYYSDTIPFYKRHREEIARLFTDASDGMAPWEIFPNWDKDDPFANETQNQNLLAWFGFEETARILCDRAEIDA